MLWGLFTKKWQQGVSAETSRLKKGWSERNKDLTWNSRRQLRKGQAESTPVRN